MKSIPLKSRIEQKIRRSSRSVFLRSDFRKLGGYDQVGRALRLLVAEGKLLKIGYGLYAKARLNRLTGKIMLAAQGGFAEVAEEALQRLGVSWEYAALTKAYQEGALQIPVSSRVIILDRFKRKIETDTFQLGVE